MLLEVCVGEYYYLLTSWFFIQNIIIYAMNILDVYILQNIVVLYIDNMLYV